MGAFFALVVYHERVRLSANESSGDGGNRTRVQMVDFKRSTYLAHLIFDSATRSERNVVLVSTIFSSRR